MPRRRHIIRNLVLVLIAVGLVGWLSLRPSNDRDWADDQAHTAKATFADDRLELRNVRDFRHCPPGENQPLQRWEDRSYDLEALDSVWLVLSLFEEGWRGPAHPFLSFGFADTAFVAISVEARRERDETYSIWKGLARRFELAYIVADERDILPLRAVCRKDSLFAYPIRTTPQRARALFRDMLGKAHDLTEHPEFYDTIRNNCTTTVIAHANAVAAEPIPSGWHALLPGYSDRVVHALGLIDADGSLEEVRRQFYINEKVERYADSADFSTLIRRSLP